VNERPPNQEDDLDEKYRRASARDGSGPSESVRRAVLRHAAELAAKRGPRELAPTKIDFEQPAANDARWRPAAYGGLAAAALVGLLVAPHFMPPSSRPPASQPPSSRQPASPPSAPTTAPRSAAEQAAAAPVPESRAPALALNPALAPRPAPTPRAGVPMETPRVPSVDDAASASNRSRRYAPAAAQRVPAPPPAPGALAAAAQAPIDAATALRQAAQSGDTQRLQALLGEQIDVNARDGAGRTALMLAVYRGQAQAVDALLARGADPNAADASGTTPLQAAVAGNQSGIIAALRRAGAR